MTNSVLRSIPSAISWLPAVAREVCQGGDKHLADRVAVDAADERPVELDEGRAQLDDVAKAGEAGPGVVDRLAVPTLPLIAGSLDLAWVLLVPVVISTHRCGWHNRRNPHAGLDEPA